MVDTVRGFVAKERCPPEAELERIVVVSRELGREIQRKLRALGFNE